MRKERALQRHSTSTSAVFNSLPKGVAQRLLRFALTKLRADATYDGIIDTESKWFHADGEIAINGVEYKLIGASANDRWESLSLYFLARGRKIRISDHWCRPDGQKSWNRGTARNAKNMGVCRSIGYSYAGLIGNDESFVVTDKETRFGPYRSESWTLGSRVFEGGWVALRDIEVY